MIRYSFGIIEVPGQFVSLSTEQKILVYVTRNNILPSISLAFNFFIKPATVFSSKSMQSKYKEDSLIRLNNLSSLLYTLINDKHV